MPARALVAVTLLIGFAVGVLCVELMMPFPTRSYSPEPPTVAAPIVLTVVIPVVVTATVTPVPTRYSWQLTATWAPTPTRLPIQPTRTPTPPWNQEKQTGSDVHDE